MRGRRGLEGVPPSVIAFAALSTVAFVLSVAKSNSGVVIFPAIFAVFWLLAIVYWRWYWAWAFMVAIDGIGLLLAPFVSWRGPFSYLLGLAHLALLLAPGTRRWVGASKTASAN